MSFDKIFKLTGSGKDIEIEISPTAKEIPEFKQIIWKDKGSKGDYDGRLKHQAKRIFLYIYYVADPRSTCANLALTDRKNKARSLAGLEEDWKETQLIVAAIVVYKDLLELSATANSYYAAEKALYALAEDIKWAHEECENHKTLLRAKIKEANSKSTVGLVDVAAMKEYSAIVTALSKAQDTLADLIERLPKLKKTVDELAAKFAEEGGGKARIHGGRELGNREA